MMEWSVIEAALDGVLERRWYTNHGPLARQLETVAAARFATRHAIIATNPTIGLMMLADALKLSGSVLIPDTAPSRYTQALSWAGLQSIPFREDRPCGHIRADTTAVIAIENEGGHLKISEFAHRCGLAFLSDRPTHFGPSVITLPSFADEAGIACVTTNDDMLAARLRNIRSSYGAGPPVPVLRTVNGRVSEIQAAMALLILALEV